MGGATHCGCSHRRIKDISGRRFGKLTVISQDGYYEHSTGRTSNWLCKCDCGREIAASKYNLFNGNNKSCGCVLAEDLAGKHFGRLKAIEWYRNKHAMIYWKCRCSCGNEVDVFQTHLKHLATTSCGCDESASITRGENVLYAVEANQRVKLGISTNLEKRMSDMQTSSPIKLKILRILKGATRAKESYIHFLLLELRSHGEWFHAEQWLINLLECVSDVDDLTAGIEKEVGMRGMVTGHRAVSEAAKQPTESS